MSRQSSHLNCLYILKDWHHHCFALLRLCIINGGTTRAPWEAGCYKILSNDSAIFSAKSVKDLTNFHIRRVKLFKNPSNHWFYPISHNKLYRHPPDILHRLTDWLTYSIFRYYYTVIYIYTVAVINVVQINYINIHITWLINMY